MRRFLRALAAMVLLGGPAVAESSPDPILDNPPLDATPSDNPAAEAIGANEAFCTDATPSVGPGFLRQVDVDGDGLNDAILDFGALTCGEAHNYCGSGGCTQEIWLDNRDGPYRPLMSALVNSITVTAPGRITVDVDWYYCNMASGPCEFDYEVRDGALAAP